MVDEVTTGLAPHFNQAFENTQAFEGNEVVKEPTGDVSFKGIRQNVYDSYVSQKGLPKKSVELLSDQERKSFVHDEFILRPKLNELNGGVFNTIFDFGFNSGPETAIKEVQKLIGAKDDGIVGPETKKMLNKFIETNGVKAANNLILDVRKKYIDSQVPEKFNKGLTSRIDAQRR